METKHRELSCVYAVNIGLGANILLSILKTTVGIIGHSPALLADGINSTSDVAYYIVVRVFMALAHKPADAEHPYGHNQLESISAIVIGAFVITTGVAIFWDAVNKVYDLWTGPGDFTGAAVGALVVALFTVGLKILLYVRTSRIGKQTNNSAVLALAYDHRNDIFAASAASIGIFLGRMGYAWIDPMAGALVAIIILRTGIEILRQSSGDLMDTVPGHVLQQQVIQALSNNTRVKCVEEVLAHRFGPYLVMNITIGIDGSLSVVQGDAIATEAEEKLFGEIDMLKRVHIHYHPVRLKAK